MAGLSNLVSRLGTRWADFIWLLGRCNSLKGPNSCRWDGCLYRCEDRPHAGSRACCPLRARRAGSLWLVQVLPTYTKSLLTGVL